MMGEKPNFGTPEPVIHPGPRPPAAKLTRAEFALYLAATGHGDGNAYTSPSMTTNRASSYLRWLNENEETVTNDR